MSIRHELRNHLERTLSLGLEKLSKEPERIFIVFAFDNDPVDFQDISQAKDGGLKELVDNSTRLSLEAKVKGQEFFCFAFLVNGELLTEPEGLKEQVLPLLEQALD